MEGEEEVIELPTYIILPRKRKEDRVYQLNLNVYRNTHYQTLNKAKKIFSQQVKPLIQDIEPITGLISMTYTITSKNNRRFDISNILCVIEKFFCDLLVDEGIIKDDSFKNLTEVNYRFGGVTGERKVSVEINKINAHFV